MFNGLKISFLFSWTWPGTWSCPPRRSWPWLWGGRPGPRWSQWSCRGRGSWGDNALFRTQTWIGRRKIIRVRVAGQRRGISGTWGGAIYSSHYKQDMVACRIWWIYRKNYLTPSESSWRQTPKRLSYVFFTWWGMVFLYPKIRGIPVYVDSCLLPCRECDRGGTRVFGQWSRHW